MSRKSSHIEPRRLKGFRDYPPELMATRQSIIDAIRQEAHLAGFESIATPAIEYAETLLGQGGEETDKEVYRFKDHGDRDIALRFDLTVPFARFVAENQGTLIFPFKKLQIGEVWRGEKPQKGRYREFVQCDIDIIGVDTAAADVEILTVLQRFLARLKLGSGFTQAVGHRLVLSALIRRFLGLPMGQETPALVVLDKLAKIGASAVETMLQAIPGANASGAQDLLAILAAKDHAGDTDFAVVQSALASESDALKDLERLKRVAWAVRESAPGGRLVVDLSIARGLGYYTGIVFETTLDALPGFGSVSSGGRYNDLAGRFTSRDLPGVGGSIGLDRLVAGLEELGQLGKPPSPALLVAVATDDALAYACSLLKVLRDAGLPSDLGLQAKLAAQFKHADRLGCKAVITVGTSERESQTYSLKVLADGSESRQLPAQGLVSELRRRGIGQDHGARVSHDSFPVSGHDNP